MKSRNAIRAAFLLVLTLFALRLAASVFSRSIEFDEALNLNVLLNLFHHGKYQSWYDGFKEFDPVVTNGPVVIMPSSLLCKAAGQPNYILARLYVLSSAFLLVAFFFREFFIKEEPARDLIPKASFFMLIFAVPLFDYESTVMLGELPGIALSVAAFYFLGSDKKRGFFLAGVLFALAVLSKLVFLISSAAVAAVFLLDLMLKRRLREWLSKAGLFLCGSLTLSLFWQGYKYLMLGRAGYLSNLANFSRFLKSRASQGTGAGTFERMFVLFPSFVGKIKGYLHLDTAAGVVLVAIVLTVLCSYIFMVMKRKEFDSFRLAVFLAGVLDVSWWVFMSKLDWYRHAFPGIVLLVMGMALITMDLSRRMPSFKTPLVVLLMVFSVVFIGCNRGFYTSFSKGAFSFRPSEKALLQKETAAKVRELYGRGALFCGYGWWQSPEISFLSGVPFYDIYNEEARAYAATVPKFLVVTTEYNVDPEDTKKAVDRYCSIPANMERFVYGPYYRILPITAWQRPFRPARYIGWEDTLGSDKLLCGFYPEETFAWATPLATVLVRPEPGDRYIVLEGYMPDPRRFAGRLDVIELICGDKSAGEKVIGWCALGKEGDFRVKFGIDKMAFAGRDVLLNIKSARMLDDGLDIRRKSFIFRAIYFSKT